MSMFTEFREFAARGNVMDLAIGVIIGTAFGAITASLVADVIMPPLGLLLSGVDFSSITIPLRDADADGKGSVVMSIGNFLQKVFVFFIVAWVMFIVVKGMNRLRRKEDPPTPSPPEPTAQERLLEEIRDLLKK